MSIEKLIFLFVFSLMEILLFVKSIIILENSTILKRLIDFFERLLYYEGKGGVAMIFNKPIVDSHVHIETRDSERTEKMLLEMKEIGVKEIAALSIVCSPDYGIEQNLLVLKWKRDSRDVKVRAFGCFHEVDSYAELPYEKQAEALLDMGCDGIKFLQMKPNYRRIIGKGVCDPSYDKALSMLEERGVPTVFHVADPFEFWDITKMSESYIARGWFYGDGRHMPYEDYYTEVFSMLSKHPRLKVSLAHFFFLANDIDKARRILEKYPNVSYDITPHPRMYTEFSENIDAWRDFFIEYQDRIIYGTDSQDERERNINIHKTAYYSLTKSRDEFPMPAYYKDKCIRGLELPESVVDKICEHNFHAFLNNKDVPLNEELIDRAARHLLRKIESDESRAESAAWLREFISKG